MSKLTDTKNDHVSQGQNTLHEQGTGTFLQVPGYDVVKY